MIAFGVAIAESEPYRLYAEPGIRLAAEPDSAIFPYAAVGTICRSYNLLLDAAAAQEGLEALVIVHPYAEIRDPEFCAKLREALRDRSVAIIGAVGATGVRSIAWWEGAVYSGRVRHRYQEHGGGETAAYAWTEPGSAPREVEALDGYLLVLSPWAVSNLRFDESLTLGQGYELDICLQARGAGRKVVVADLHIVHHRELELVGDLDIWVEAHIRMAEKWNDEIGRSGKGVNWKQRARRAEAEREAARATAMSTALASDARVLDLERALADRTETLSWRITAPLRKLNRRLTDAVRGVRQRERSP
ncbi:MAG: glycosyltransferase [Solirubrobacteraceae bacterium]